MEEAEHVRWRWQNVSEGKGLAHQVEEESVYQVQLLNIHTAEDAPNAPSNTHGQMV